MKFNPHVVLANQQFLEAEMGQCFTSVHQNSIQYHMFHDINVYQTEEGLRTDAPMPKGHYCKTVEEVFGFIKTELNKRMGELQALPCMTEAR